jgi:hypothetical protein
MVLDETVHFYRHSIKIVWCLQTRCPIHVLSRRSKIPLFFRYGNCQTSRVVACMHLVGSPYRKTARNFKDVYCLSMIIAKG